jgi:hypothetical protein
MGGVVLDSFESDDAIGHDRALWWKVLKNVRAGLMPPPKRDRLSAEELSLLESWIKPQGLGIDPNDPGHVVQRRLNRVEYRNTIRELMGVDYNTISELPSDDTGYSFDNISEVLTLLPLLLEKHFVQVVPTAPRAIALKSIAGQRFRGKGDRLPPWPHLYRQVGSGQRLASGSDLAIRGSAGGQHRHAIQAGRQKPANAGWQTR